MLIVVGASVLRTNKFEQSKGIYSIVNVFVKGEFERALFEVHYRHIDFEYPDRFEFEAVISQSVVGKFTTMLDPVKVDTPQVSP